MGKMLCLFVCQVHVNADTSVRKVSIGVEVWVVFEDLLVSKSTVIASNALVNICVTFVFVEDFSLF